MVALGGSLTLGGSEASEVTSQAGTAPKADPTRSQVTGGPTSASLGATRLSPTRMSPILGFWSGNTGGLSLTGTDAVGTVTEQQPTPQKTREADGGARLLPEAELKDLTQGSAQDYSLVTAGIENLRVDNNAFGLFVTNARDVIIRDTTISGSLVDGLVLHRFVTNATITGTSSSGNAVDGFSIGRSTEKISFENIQARDNGRNGLSMDGRPLADGPNAVGTAVDGYGGNQVSGGAFENNARYGIEVVGGAGLTVRNNRLVRNEVGIVAADGATGVVIDHNTLLEQARQAVAYGTLGPRPRLPETQSPAGIQEFTCATPGPS